MRQHFHAAALLILLLPLGTLGWFRSGSSAPSSSRTPSPSSPPGPPPHFSVVPLDRQREGHSQIASLQHAAGSETFLDKMLGTNCYSRAVSELERDCSRLDQLQKSRLALGLANCQLATQGQDTYPCSNSEPLRACVDRLPDRENFMYIEFLTHVDSMCLFIQNQQFEKHTEMMLNVLSEGAGFAKEQLAAMGARTQELSQDTAAIRAAAVDTVARLKEQKDLQIEAIDVVKQHRAENAARFDELSAQQIEALRLAERQLEVGKKIEETTEEVERRIISGQNQLESLFGKLEDKAVALVQAQDMAAQVQHDLGEQLKSLSDGTRGLRTAVDTVAEYQRRSDAALIKLLGRSYTLEDAVFYGAGVVAAMAAGASKATEGARLPVLGLLGVNILAERMLLEKLHVWLDVDSAGEVILTIPTPSWLLKGDGSNFSVLIKPLTMNFRSSLRRVCAVLCAGVLLVTIFSYRNWERASYRRLEQIHEDIKDIQNLTRQNEEIIKARLEFLEKLSGHGGKNQGGAGTSRPAVAKAKATVPLSPPPAITDQYLLSNGYQRTTGGEPHGFGSEIDNGSDDQEALNNGNQQVALLLPSPDQAAEQRTAHQSKPRARRTLRTIPEEGENNDEESQEIAPQRKTRSTGRGRPLVGTASDGSQEVPLNGRTRARMSEASDIQLDDTCQQLHLGRQTSKRHSTEEGSQPSSSAKRRRKK